MPEERFLIIQLHELLTYLGQAGVATHPDRRATRADRQPDAHAGRRELPRRRGDPAALLRGRRRGPPGDLGHQEARRRARADHPRVPARQRTASASGEPLRDFRGVLTGVPIYEGRRPLRRQRSRDRPPTRRREQRVLVLAPTAQGRELTQAHARAGAGIACESAADLDAAVRGARARARARC